MALKSKVVIISHLGKFTSKSKALAWASMAKIRVNLLLDRAKQFKTPIMR